MSKSNDYLMPVRTFAYPYWGSSQSYRGHSWNIWGVHCCTIVMQHQHGPDQGMVKLEGEFALAISFGDRRYKLLTCRDGNRSLDLSSESSWVEGSIFLGTM